MKIACALVCVCVCEPRARAHTQEVSDKLAILALVAGGGSLAGQFEGGIHPACCVSDVTVIIVTGP